MADNARIYSVDELIAKERKRTNDWDKCPQCGYVDNEYCAHGFHIQEATDGKS